MCKVFFIFLLVCCCFLYSVCEIFAVCLCKYLITALLILMLLLTFTISPLTQRGSSKPAASISVRLPQSCVTPESPVLSTSLMLSSHRFLWLPLLLAPLTVPCKMVFGQPGRMIGRHVRTTSASVSSLYIVRSSSWRPMAC